MNIEMNDQALKQPNDIAAFLGATEDVELKLARQDHYVWIARVLKRTCYFKLRKRDKMVVTEYLRKLTGYSRQHLTRLITQYRKKCWIGKKVYARHKFAKHYTREDILLLVKVDEYHDTLSGGATKKLFERAYHVFKDEAYVRLANISISHIYNLRRDIFYTRQRVYFSKTKSTTVPIGERRKPQPDNKPGYIRIDTVHQGDKDGVKGVYHINAVDEVTQMEVVFSVEQISENCLIPVLEVLLEEFPFVIINFHSDNGSEYVNQYVVKLLNKLHIEFTKSRARHSNDNALAESKNGSIVRKLLGYLHIPQHWAPRLNIFHKEYLIPYINYHRPCHFSETIVDKKTGKEKKVYRYKDIMTPYERFKSLPNPEQYLKPGVTIEALDVVAMEVTDLESAKRMKNARKELFKEIFGE